MDIEGTNRCRRRRKKNTGVRNSIKLNADKTNVYNVNKTYKDESKMDEEQIPYKAEYKDLTITIRAWNTRSLNNTSKLKQILKSGADVLLLQEIWKPKKEYMEVLKNKTYYTMLREDGYGGTMLLCNTDGLKPLGVPITVNQDSQIIKMNVGGDRNIWISSTYIHKRNKKLLLEYLGEVSKVVPEDEWPYVVLGGDWNVDLTKDEDKTTQTLKATCKNMGLRIQRCEYMHKNSEIDFFVLGSQIRTVDMSSIEMIESDHNSPQIRIKVSVPTTSRRKIRVPNKKLANAFTQEALNKCLNGTDFAARMYKKYKYNRNKLMVVSRNRPRDNELLERILRSEEEDDSFKIIREYWREKAQDCEEDLLNNRLDKAFKFLRQTRKYHEYKRRDGSIISQIRKEDGTVTTVEEEVHESIINNLKLIQTSQTQPKYDDPLPFPYMPILDETEMEYITSKIYSGKAGAFDGCD